MAQTQLHCQEEHGECELKSEDEDDEIDIVGMKSDELLVDNGSQDLQLDSGSVALKKRATDSNLQDDFEPHSEDFSMDTELGVKENSEISKSKTNREESEMENCEEDINKEQKNTDCSTTETIGINDSHALRTIDNDGDDNDESSCPSRTTSSCSSRVSSRQNSFNDSVAAKNIEMDLDYEMKEAPFNDGLGSQVYDDDDDDNDDFRPSDPYERFFFESDYLALKDNKHYHQLLQTLVALEGQRMQAIKDLDTLCEEEAKALDDPIGFVEKLQNNEPLGLPMPQNIVKLPKIPWEMYATSLGPVDMNLPIQHHTRASTSYADKVTGPTSVVPSPSTGSALSTPQESQTSSLFASDRSTSNRESNTIFSETLNKNNEPGKLPTFNQSWSVEEQTRLEKLLQTYPQEEIESKRWEKIAKALGNRTPKQVASRVQKFFIKLAKAGLPIPGRIPNIPRSGSRTAKRSSHYQTMGFRNSTFFPSYQPRVYMDDNKDDDDESSVAFSDDTSYQSDDESIPEQLKQTRDYMELMELKKIKRHKLRHGDQLQQDSTSHTGYMCDGCGVSPIVGSRWYCHDCSHEASMDFCSSCVERGIPESRGHDRHHRLEQITKAMPYFMDGDYVGMTGSAATGYNYLDPNFLPAAS